MGKENKREKVRDRMSRSPVTVNSGESLQAAIDLLYKYNIRELPVLDRGKVVGIVTDRDLRQVSPSYPVFRDQEEIRCYLQTLKVVSAMSIDPQVVSPDDSLLEAAKLLQTLRIGSLPVVQDEKLVGIISVTDLLGAFIEQNQPPSAKT